MDAREQAQRLMDALETQAERMSNIETMANVLIDWDIYADGCIRQEARMERRRQANGMLLCIAHLARHYHDEAMGALGEIAGEDRA